MNTRLHEAHFGVPKPEIATQSLYDSRRPAFPHGSWKGREVERETKNLTPVIQAAPNESYMRKNAKLNDSIPTRDYQELWDILKNAIKLEISVPSYETWIEPIVPVGYHSASLVVAASSKFNEEQVLKRYGYRLKELIQELTDSTIKLEVIIDESLQTHLEAKTPLVTYLPTKRRGKNAYGIHQNPTNNPIVDELLERHGCMRGIFLETESFQKVWRSRDKGGWGMKFGSLLKAGKEHGLERLLWARKVMKVDEDLADNPGGLFLYYARTGKVNKK
jgi:hypothetical protein